MTTGMISLINRGRAYINEKNIKRENITSTSQLKNVTQ
jgi:hypothetical protein